MATDARVLLAVLVLISGCWNGDIKSPTDACPSCPQGAVADGKTCKVRPYDRIPTDALIKGFYAAEMQITRAQPAGFQVAVPDQSQLLTCALFICDPPFDTVEISDPKLGRMLGSNCIYRQRVYSPVERPATGFISFNIEDLELSKQECSDNGANSEVPPVITDLALGCWAFGEVRPLGATRMLKLSPDELAKNGHVPILDCNPAEGHVESSYCYLEGKVGVCEQSNCVAPPTARPSKAVIAVDGGASVSAPDASLAMDRLLPPVITCDDQHKGFKCLRDNLDEGGINEAIGQCTNGTCLPRAEFTLELALVVTSCARERSESGDAGMPQTTTSDPSDFNKQGFNCFPTWNGDFGTCTDGVCRRRCLSSDDCMMNIGTHEDAICNGAERSKLGVCKEQ